MWGDRPRGYKLPQQRLTNIALSEHLKALEERIALLEDINNTLSFEVSRLEGIVYEIQNKVNNGS